MNELIYSALVCGDVLIDAGERVAALAGPFADAETLTVTRDLLNILGSEHYYTEEYCDVNTDFRSHYLMNLPLRTELIQLSDYDLKITKLTQ